MSEFKRLTRVEFVQGTDSAETEVQPNASQEEILETLYDYEDIGLTPEEIKAKLAELEEYKQRAKGVDYVKD